MAEVHVRWRTFVAERRYLAPVARLVFYGSDLVGCYDTIAQLRLLQGLSFTLQLRAGSSPTFIQSRLGVSYGHTNLPKSRCGCYPRTPLQPTSVRPTMAALASSYMELLLPRPRRKCVWQPRPRDCGEAGR